MDIKLKEEKVNKWIEKDKRSRPEVFCKKGALRNFVNVQENTCARVSSGTPFITEHHQWLLLNY